MSGSWSSVRIILLACASLFSLRADQSYYWQFHPVDGSAQLLTLYCHACENTTASGRDIPLVAVLRDTLGDLQAKNDRVTYVWLLTYSRPIWKSASSPLSPSFIGRSAMALPTSATMTSNR